MSHRTSSFGLLVFAFLSAWCGQLAAQERVVARDSSGDDAGLVVLRPTIPAYFPGCSAYPEGSAGKTECSGRELMAFVGRELGYPEAAREESIEGVVVLSFVVNATGGIRDARVLRDIGGGCGEEALRVVNAMPRWQPAIDEGRTVATPFTLPLTFSLQAGSYDYRLHLGELVDGEALREEIVAGVTGGEARVTDPKGAEMVVAEVVYTFERGGERRELVTRGPKPPVEKAFAKFLGRKPGRLTVEANVVDGLDIRPVTLSLTLVR